MEWKIVEHSRVMPNRYKVSEDGQVVNTERNRPVKTFKDSGGYIRVHLMTPDRDDITERVHRLVATAFVERDSDDQLHIDHIDGNRENNCASNLRWCTRLQNSHNPITVNRSAIAHKVAEASLSRKVICENTGEVFNSMTEAGNAYGISLSAVAQSCRKAEQGKPRRSTKFGKPVMHFKFAPMEEVVVQPDSEETMWLSMNKSNSKPVRCIEDGNVFTSVSAAARAYGLSVATVSGSCKRAPTSTKKASAFGAKRCYHFEFVTEG